MNVVKDLIGTDVEEQSASDVIRGAENIARYVFGQGGKSGRRRVYYAYQCRRLPIFRSSPRSPYFAYKPSLDRCRQMQEQQSTRDLSLQEATS